MNPIRRLSSPKTHSMLIGAYLDRHLVVAECARRAYFGRGLTALEMQTAVPDHNDENPQFVLDQSLWRDCNRCGNRERERMTKTHGRFMREGLHRLGDRGQ